ncbi:DeoR family transcriptional regulator [Pullulanibacillus camelliae]|uniref:DeoR family transcriptional regulator n=1 Tax=Pullulanibacillus camelliae TaxID=1707096 RepID=A0A8J2VM22_9BACL|nr:metalloregulator ArsR/SmtB family transcription factor [Pullulanibacillus camelliae]GGE31612.1 DeoR family transcriptional regulator [Pullulanibacillus camelliae]
MATITTKDKILELLKKEVTLTVGALTTHLEITHMAVRKHLNSLEKDGLIKSVEVKQAMGRPLLTYSLSDKGERLFPNNYEGLSVEFLQDIKDLHGEASIHHLFKRRETRQSENYLVRMANKSPVERLHEIINIQNEKGYMAELKQLDERTFEITEYNCPILAIANEFKVACRSETSMLKRVLTADQIDRTCCRTEGHAHCKFVIQFK